MLPKQAAGQSCCASERRLDSARPPSPPACPARPPTHPTLAEPHGIVQALAAALAVINQECGYAQSAAGTIHLVASTKQHVQVHECLFDHPVTSCFPLLHPLLLPPHPTPTWPSPTGGAGGVTAPSTSRLTWSKQPTWTRRGATSLSSTRTASSPCLHGPALIQTQQGSAPSSRVGGWARRVAGWMWGGGCRRKCLGRVWGRRGLLGRGWPGGGGAAAAGRLCFLPHCLLRATYVASTCHHTPVLL